MPRESHYWEGLIKVSIKRFLVIALIVAIGLTSVALSACQTKTSLDIRGSDTMVNLGAAWAEKFMAKNSKNTVIVQGGGSGTGATSLINKNTDIAQMSRPMKDSEKAEVKSKTTKDAKEFIVAYDGVAMVVHKDNPLNELTMAQLAQIYKGEITNWKDLGGTDTPIVALARDTASGTHVFIKEHVLGNKEYGANVQFISATQAIHNEVAGNVRAIGYIGLGYLDDAVKALGVKKDADSPAVLPSLATVKDKTYVVSRPLYNYTAGDPTGVVKAYLDFVMSTEGQQIVAQLGFVPVK